MGQTSSQVARCATIPKTIGPGGAHRERNWELSNGLIGVSLPFSAVYMRG
jgi:hypothetical protein